MPAGVPVVLLVVAALVPATAAAKPPSLEQYTITVPGAGGPEEVRQKPVVVEPDVLGEAASQELSGPEDRALRRVAGSPALGAAPVAARVDVDTSSEGFVAGLGSALGSAQALLLLAGLGLCTGALVAFGRRARNDGGPGS